MNILCLYAKAPVAGKSKTRLAQDIGNDMAAEIARAMLQDILTITESLDNITVQLWSPPNTKVADYNMDFPDEMLFYTQEGKDLGERMAHTFKTLLKEENRVIIIGSDCVTHEKHILEDAFSRLETEDVILREADDGGYVLIGMRHYYELFSTSEWGSDTVFQTTRDSILKTNAHFYELEKTFDIDFMADLHKALEYLDDNRSTKTYQLIKSIERKNGL
ncbi:MAG: glycosyltransferase [Lentisphaeria bacterium]|nr:TIGR04282 family arsenosugar biosynthesis glycosyltransferase [Lentisphaeria bacterium]NQZ70840.1 glycosyltransferase [Lentisphaeria bacterium]